MFYVQCFSSSWYISVDIQLFIIAPAIVYSINRYAAKTFIILFGLIVSCVGFTLAAHAEHNLRNMYVYFLHSDFWDKSTNSVFWSRFWLIESLFTHRLEPRFVELFHIPTHLRFSPWLCGFITGYLLTEFPIGSICIPKVIKIQVLIPISFFLTW